MKLIRILRKNIRDGIKSVKRNLSLSIASISCITITLLVVSVAIIAAYNLENITKRVKKDFTIVAFIKTDTKEENIKNLMKDIKLYKNVESVNYQTKKEVANEIKNSSDSLSNIIDTWTDDTNPLYDTLLIKVKDTEKISQTAEKIKQINYVVDINYGEGIVESLLTVFKVVEKAIIVAMVALLFVTLFLISNTIKITIFSRKREIEIMRLVGASNFSIKQPFVIEGFILGFLGSIIPILVSIYGYDFLYNHFKGQLFSPFFKLVPSTPFVYIVSLILLFIGIVVGMFGSYRSVRKYLKI